MSRNRGHWQDCTPREQAMLQSEPRVIELRGLVLTAFAIFVIGGTLLVLTMAVLP